MLKNQILNAVGRKIHTFPVEQWGFSVCVRGWSVAERKEVMQDFDALKDKPDTDSLDFYCRVAIMSLCDEKGQLLFTQDDIPALREKDFPALKLICNEAIKLNKLGDDEKKS